MAGPEARPELVTSAEHLADLVRRVVAAPRYALDTEFHREKSYWPRLALLQLAWYEGPEATHRSPSSTRSR